MDPKALEVSRQIRLEKNGNDAWGWVGLKVAGDLTGYTKVVAKITGPAGEKFLFKTNDNGAGESWVTTTGEEQDVEITLPAGFAWNAENQTMVLFPNPDELGQGHTFVITKLELQGEGKDTIDLLAAQITNGCTIINVARDLVITKPTTNTNTWDCVVLDLGKDFSKYTGVAYAIKGTAGERFMIKVNDTKETWIDLTGKWQTGIASVEGLTFTTSKASIVLFPNPDASGTGNKVIVSQLVYLNPLAWHDGTEADPYTVADAKNIAKDFSKSTYDQTNKVNVYGDVKDVWVKGYVVDQGEDKGVFSQNIKLADEKGGTATLLVYSVDETESIKDVRLNDLVVIHGYIMNYNGTIEISSYTPADGDKINPVFVSCVRGENSVSVDNNSSDKATVSEITPASGANESTFTFKVTVEKGFEVDAVKVNGAIVEAENGVYTAKISGPTTILVQTKEAGAVVLPSMTMNGNAAEVAGGEGSTDMTAKDGFYQTGGTVQKYSYQILASEPYYETAPAKLIVKVKLGAGSDKTFTDETNAAFLVLLDKDGNEIESTRKMITKAFLKNTETYEVEVVPTAAFAGIKVYETKVASWNMRLYSITVEEAAAETPKANVNLLEDLPTPNADYQSPNWTYEQYQSDGWKVLTSVQMRARTNGGIPVTNFAVSTSTMRATFSKGESLGLANTLSFKAANDYTGAAEMSVKLKVVDVNDHDIYVLGGEGDNGWVTLPVQALKAYKLTFDEAEIKAVVVVAKSAANGKYLYIGDFFLTYEEEQPASSPATFELTNLDKTDNNRNHIDGAGIWIWVKPESIGYTGAEHANFRVSATVEGFTVNDAFLSDPSETAVRCYVLLGSAPAADATVVVNLTIAHGDSTFQGNVVFTANELAH